MKKHTPIILSGIMILLLGGLFAQENSKSNVSSTHNKTSESVDLMRNPDGSIDTHSRNRQYVALGEFVNKTDANEPYFNSMIDLMKNSLVNTRKFHVVERDRIKDLMKEHQLSSEGLTDTNDSKKPEVNKLKSAGYIIYGTILHLGSEAREINVTGVQGEKVTFVVKLQIEITDVESGKILASKSVEGQATKIVTGNVSSSHETDALMAAMEEAAREVANALVDLAFPSSIIDIHENGEIVVGLTQEQTKINRVYNVYSVGKDLFDAHTGESLGQSETHEGRIVIIRTSPKFSYAKSLPPLNTSKLKSGMIIRSLSDDEIQSLEKEQKTIEKREFESRF